MKNIYTYGILAFALLSFAIDPQESLAKSVQWNTTVNESLRYCWSWGSDISSCPDITHWVLGLGSPNITVKYLATITNEDTGETIADGATIPTGTRIRLVPTTYDRDHVSWFGTGYSEDSPYGYWYENPDSIAPSQYCDSSNYVGTTKAGKNNVKVYSPLIVKPSNISFDHSGTANITCTENGSLCNVNTSGTIQVKVLFAQTSGMFYYGYQYGNGECIANGIPMTVVSAWNYGGKGSKWVKSVSTYTLGVPSQNISFNLTAVSTNNPPNPPTISGATSFNINTIQTFSFTATDPDNDVVRYQIDWNNDSQADEYTPAGGAYVSSGSMQNTDRQWTTAGTYTIQARTADNKGLTSSWSTHTVTVTNPAPSLTFTADSTNLVYSNTGTTLRWTGTNVTSCTASNGWTGTKAVNDSESTGSLTANKTYELTCIGSTGTVSKSVTVSVEDPASCTLPWGGSLAHGASATAYQNSSAAYNTSCVSESRTCTNGTLSGSYTNQSCTVDAPPAPTATLQVRVNGGSWTTTAQIIEPTDTVNLQWGSANASICNASRFDTAGAISGTATTVTEPSAGNTTTYLVQCTGASGTRPATASVDVTTRSHKPTLTPNSTMVTSGSKTALNYDLNGNPSCTFTSNDSTLNNVTVITDGAKTTGAITQQTAYTLTCDGGSASTVINVEGNIQEQ